jgi:hypothetical protein
VRHSPYSTVSDTSAQFRLFTNAEPKKARQENATKLTEPPPKK